MNTPIDQYQYLYCLHNDRDDRRIGRRILLVPPSILSIILILTFLGCDSPNTTIYVTSFPISNAIASSRCSFVKVVPSVQLQHLHQPSTSIYHQRNEMHKNERNRCTVSSSPMRRLVVSVPTRMLFTNNPMYPLLDVALDQPLYTPIRRYFWENGFNFILFRMNVLLKGIMGLLPALFHAFDDIVLSKTITQRFIKYALISLTIFICSKYIMNKTDQSTTISSTINPSVSSVTQKEVVPMPFDSNINEGWSICKLQSIVPYGEGKKKQTVSPYIHIKMALPQPNYILPLQLGQPIHICGLDRNGNAVQAEFYPFDDSLSSSSSSSSSRSNPTPGYFSLLVPNPSKYECSSNDEIATLGSDENSNNDLQQVRVIQLLQDYMSTGDTEIAIHPGVTTKLQYRGSHYPVTEIIYLAIGSTGIVPVLDQVRTVLYSSTTSKQTGNVGSYVGRVSVVWITSSIEEYDTLSHLLKQLYDKYSTQLAVSCGVETHLQSSMTQEIAAEYFMDNNVEINDTIPTFQPGTMAIISIEGIPYMSASLLRQVATTYLQRKKGFPVECICVL